LSLVAKQRLGTRQKSLVGGLLFAPVGEWARVGEVVSSSTSWRASRVKGPEIEAFRPKSKINGVCSWPTRFARGTAFAVDVETMKGSSD